MTMAVLFLMLSDYLPSLAALLANTVIMPAIIEELVPLEGSYLQSEVSQRLARSLCLAVLLLPRRLTDWILPRGSYLFCVPFAVAFLAKQAV
jgi:hypothetical protein